MFQMYLDVSEMFSFCLMFIQLSEGLSSSHHENVPFRFKELRTVIFRKQHRTVWSGILGVVFFVCFQQTYLAFQVRKLTEMGLTI